MASATGATGTTAGTTRAVTLLNSNAVHLHLNMQTVGCRYEV